MQKNRFKNVVHKYVILGLNIGKKYITCVVLWMYVQYGELRYIKGYVPQHRLNDGPRLATR